MVSQALIERIRQEAGEENPAVLEGLEPAGDQEVKGRSSKIQIFALRRP